MFPHTATSIFLVNETSDMILFKCASYWAEQGKNVWFIAPEPISELPEDWDLSDREILKLITFLYLTNTKELLQQLNSVHIWHKTPTLIIVKDFQHYLSSKDVSVNALTCASLIDACATCSNKLGSKHSFIIASHDKNNLEKCSILQELYFKNVISNNKDDVFNDIVKLFETQ